MTITVTDVDEAPVVTGEAAIMTSAENAAIGTDMDMYTANDPETNRDAPTLRWWGLTEASSTSTLTVDGRLTFKAAPDYEKPGDADKDNVYEVTVEATDGKATPG